MEDETFQKAAANCNYYLIEPSSCVTWVIIYHVILCCHLPRYPRQGQVTTGKGERVGIYGVL